MAKKTNENRNVTKKELDESIDLMLKVTAVSEAVQARYTTMLDFLDSKGLMKEWEKYFLDHTLNKQNPAAN